MKNKNFNVFGKIIGRVQGVGYRAWTKKTAIKYNLSGWVINCLDNSVEFEVSGGKSDIESFINECHKGPLLSNVESIKYHEVKFSKYKNFEIRYK